HKLFEDELFNGIDIDTMKSSRTDGRGHLYFKYTDKIKSQKHHDLGFEILSDGSNAVLPPSKHVSGEVYHWKDGSVEMAEFPDDLIERMNILIGIKTRVSSLIRKTRKCFKVLWDNKPDLHGANGREMMLAFCTELKANGASLEDICFVAKLIYKKDFDSARTELEFNNIDESKTWQCNTLESKFPTFIDCNNCNVKRLETPPKEDLCEVTNPPITGESIQVKLKSIIVDEDILKKMETALRFIETELITLDKPSKNTVINTYIKEHFEFTAAQARDIISTANKKKPKEEIKEKTISDYSKYFEGNSFVPKYLGDEILQENHILTLQDTRELLVYTNGRYEKNTGEDKIRVISLTKLDSQFRKDRTNEAVEYVKLNTFVDRECLDNSTVFINVRNGMYDVLNDKLLPHDPKYNSSIQVNINYNPSAECPKINKFLGEILDPGDIPPIIQLAGYCFTSDIKMQKAGLFVGGTENGKSTFLEMLSHGIGQENIAEQSIQALNSEKWARAQLQGKLVNIFPDLPKQKLYDNSVFKMLTTDQWIDGEEKYLKPFRFRNITKQIYSANAVPALHDPDEAAFFRRWLIFLFPNTFNGDIGNKKANKNLINELTTDEEQAGFFNLAMEGLRFLLKNNVFAYLRTDEDVKKLYLMKSSPVACFMDECVMYSDYDCPKQSLYEDYCEWCEENKLGVSLKNNMFGKELKKLGYEDDREHTDLRQYVWRNVCSVWAAVRDSSRTQTDFNTSTDTYFNL
ncbi:MAG: phage/plasmid primase, P4 family, partial [Desulfobacterales bacterium]|nr:phage/plasmid primase, P4 family [Desulfobacterales bacterium]